MRLASGNATGEDVLCLALPRRLLSSNASYEVRRVALCHPRATANESLPLAPDCVRRVWSDARRALTLVELAPLAVHWLHARGATCRAPATPLAGMRATCFTCSSDGMLEKRYVTLVRVDVEAVSVAQCDSQRRGSADAREALLFSSDGSLLAVESVARHESVVLIKSQVFRVDSIAEHFLMDRSRERR